MSFAGCPFPSSASSPELTAGRSPPRKKPPGGVPFRLAAAPSLRRPAGGTSEACGAASSSSIAPTFGQGAQLHEHRQLTPTSRKAARHVQKMIGSSHDGSDTLHWRLMHELDHVDGRVAAELEKQKAREEALKFQKILLDQANTTQSSQAEQRANAKWWRGQLEAADQHSREEAAQEQKRGAQARQQHWQAQRDQLQEVRRRDAAAQAEELASSQEMWRQQAQATRKAKEQDEELRRRKGEMALEREAAASAAREQRRQKKREETARDLEFARLQRAHVEAQGRKRQAEAEQLKERQASLCRQQEAGFVDEVALRQAEDEARATRHREERLQREAAEQQRRAQAKRERLNEMKDSVQLQLQEQAKCQAERREESRRSRQEVDREARQAAAEAKEKERQRRERDHLQQEFLKGQMLQRPVLGKFGAEQMNETEKSFNKERLAWASAPHGLDVLYAGKQHQYKSLPPMDASG